MATAMSRPTFALQPPVLEDTMEISSERGHVDDDIDIDFEPEYEELLFEDDDQMLDDAKPVNDTTNTALPFPAHENDDIMVDDAVGDEVTVDGMMQDDATLQEEDEELLDFSDLEEQDQHGNNTLVEGEIATHDATALDPSMAYDALEEISGFDAVPMTEHGEERRQSFLQSSHEEQEQEHSVLVAANNEQKNGHDEDNLVEEGDGVTLSAPQVALESAEAEATSFEHPTAVIKSRSPISSPGRGIDNEKLQHAQDVESASQQQAETTQLQIDTAIAAQEVQDPEFATAEWHATPTSTGLHQTIVKYQGMEVDLFPSGDPSSSEQYFLDNEDLVNGCIGDMLKACRPVLKDTISQDEELELGVEELGLYLSEDSMSAFSTSFAEVLDVYVKLQKNDGVENVPPLYITLTARPTFTGRLASIVRAASDGKGLSKVPTPQPEEYQDDNYDGDDAYAEDDTDISHVAEEKSLAGDDASVIPTEQSVLANVQTEAGGVTSLFAEEYDDEPSLTDNNNKPVELLAASDDLNHNAPHDHEGVEIQLTHDDEGEGPEHSGQRPDVLVKDTAGTENTESSPGTSATLVADDEVNPETHEAGQDSYDDNGLNEHIDQRHSPADLLEDELDDFDGEEQSNDTAAFEINEDRAAHEGTFAGHDASQHADDLYDDTYDGEPGAAVQEADDDFLDTEQENLEQDKQGIDQEPDRVWGDQDRATIAVSPTTEDFANGTKYNEVNQFEEIDFDDDFEEEVPASKAASGPGPSDLKRSWSERTVEDDTLDTDQEPKRARPA